MVVARLSIVAAIASGGCGRGGFDQSCDDAHPSTTATANIAFVTSTTALPTTFGSDLSGADKACNDRAQAAQLPGSYVALISTSSARAHDRLAGSRGWVRVDGKPVLDQIDDIANGKMFFPVELDETGAMVQDVVATGTLNDGSIGANCKDYTDPADVLSFGLSSTTTGNWIGSGNTDCVTAMRIYCFGVGRADPLIVQPASGRVAFVSVENVMLDATGLHSADAVCQNEAQVAGLSGAFAALLPTAAAPAISRFSLAGPTWVRVDGIPIAATTLDFAAGTLVAPINVTAVGGYSGYTPVMTGGSTPTSVQPDTLASCANWTDPTGTSSVGLANDSGPGAFMASTGGTCKGPVYCVEQ